MKVTRVQTAHGSHLEPPLEDWWSNLTKLEWHAAAVADETGIEHVRVTPSRYSIGGIPQWGYYCVQVGFGHSVAPLNFRAAWSYLNGVAQGVKSAPAT